MKQLALLSLALLRCTFPLNLVSPVRPPPDLALTLTVHALLQMFRELGDALVVEDVLQSTRHLNRRVAVGDFVPTHTTLHALFSPLPWLIKRMWTVGWYYDPLRQLKQHPAILHAIIKILVRLGPEKICYITRLACNDIQRP